MEKGYRVRIVRGDITTSKTGAAAACGPYGKLAPNLPPTTFPQAQRRRPYGWTQLRGEQDTPTQSLHRFRLIRKKGSKAIDLAEYLLPADS